MLIFVVVLLFTPFLLFAFAKNRQSSGLKSGSFISSHEINEYLDILNHERFTDESKQSVRNFLKSEFQKYGYNVTEQKTDGYVNGINERRMFINIIADKGDLNENYVLIGAHYDTVPGTTGVDDNASGVTALLALAKYNQNPNIRFVAFDGEEYNLSGSRYYIKNTVQKPQLMLSLETIGYYSDEPNSQAIPVFYDWAYRSLYNRLASNQFRGNFSTSVCSRNANDFCKKYESYASSLGLQVYTVYVPSLSFIRNFFVDLFRSDHTPFLLEGIPAVMITDSADFRSPNYHTVTDVRETVRADFIARQSNAILAIISE
jgi:aminopeptidase YwaD